jgi:predicted DNA-binding transcriptional regulator AlpA
MARPRKPTNVLEILRLRLEGLSWPQIAHSTGLGQGTVYRAYRKAIDALNLSKTPRRRN